MASLGTFDVMADTVMTATVHVRPSFRFKIGLCLLWLACRVMQCGLTVEQDNG